MRCTPVGTITAGSTVRFFLTATVGADDEVNIDSVEFRYLATQ